MTQHKMTDAQRIERARTALLNALDLLVAIQEGRDNAQSDHAAQVIIKGYGVFRRTGKGE